MSRSAHIFAAAAVLATLRGAALAEEPAAWIEELRALRQLVEQQSKQLDGLSKQVARLTAVVEGKVAAKAEPEPVSVVEPVPAVPEKPAAPAAEEAPANAPKAEPAGLPKHLVLKGETLTSIAKHYNIPLVDLQKANKDLNPAKLQIGQSINIPAAKNPEPASDKKENP